MGRGKIEIKRIENHTNRQVTYSKRRNGIFKKAQELTVLCDAKVSLIMFSSTGKFHEYISPSTSTKKIFDLYQKTSGIDLWQTHYEAMQQNLKQLKDINYKLRRDIRQRLGHDLDGVTYDELRSLEESMHSSLEAIRDRKYHKIKTQTETCKKKVNSLRQRHVNLMQSYQAKCEDPPYGLVDDNDEDYESAVALANGASNLYAFRHQPHTHTHPNIQNGVGFGSYDLHDLRLA
ncbi:agamous-like MADS-box protein TM6 [Ziziphus jujuba]|uniref:Agamous-like MADS-box protein TM6 n=1 Tax=Ziziphus jujuba TaxID=326968 RepID=A0ABM3ITI4_ZIZJJ|nr:agamous-like MADS-box protein TM6 [Ziziphus jujuba]